jgi:hypothetical protein
VAEAAKEGGGGEDPMKPSELFIGVVDLFAVLLPGAILAFLTNYALLRFGPYFGHDLVRDIDHNLDGTGRAFAFFLESYLFGHFVYGLSSPLDNLYDRLRNEAGTTKLYDLVTQIRGKHARAAHEAVATETIDKWPDPKSLDRWTRAIAWLTQGSWRADLPKTDNVMNTFKFALALLQLRDPASLLAVRRLEADSKFFRSVVVLLVVLLPVTGAQIVWHMATTHAGQPPTWLVDVALGLIDWALLRMSFARYCEQRQKTVELAYQLLVVSTALEAEGATAHHATTTIEIAD